MKKLLVVIDMQNDFIDGSLGSLEAQAIVPAVKAKIEAYRKANDKILFTRDTHPINYLETQEGKNLPVEHCISGTHGHQIASMLNTTGCTVIDKPSFGSFELAEQVAALSHEFETIEICGLCTDICVVSNALILKARLPEMQILVDVNCCAGVTIESHKAALLTMKMCQINLLNE